MFGKLRQRWRRAREVATARRIARNMAALGGPDVTHLPDDQLVVEVRAMTQAMARRVRVAQASLPNSETMADALRRMGGHIHPLVNGFASGGGGFIPEPAPVGSFTGTLDVTFPDCGHTVPLHGDGSGPLKVPDHCPRCAED